MRALIEVTSLSAWTTALMKKDINPSFTPCFATKSSWICLRSFITADISASLKVVRMAAVCWALTRCWEILRRSGVIFLLVKRPSSADGAIFFFWIEVGAAWTGSFSCSVFCNREVPFSSLIPSGAGPVVSVPRVAPMSISDPSETSILMTPATSASSSDETLSVSRVTMTSPSLT